MKWKNARIKEFKKIILIMMELEIFVGDIGITNKGMNKITLEFYKVCYNFKKKCKILKKRN